MMDLVKECLICQRSVDVNIEKDMDNSKKSWKLCSQGCKQYLQYCLGFAHGLIMFQVLCKLCGHVHVQRLSQAFASATSSFAKDFVQSVASHSHKMTIKGEQKDLPHSDRGIRDLELFFETQSQTESKHTTVGSQTTTIDSVKDAVSCSESEGETVVDLDDTKTCENENNLQKSNKSLQFSKADQAQTDRQTDSAYYLDTITSKEKCFSSQNKMIACEKSKIKRVKGNFKCNECSGHFHSESCLHKHFERIHLNNLTMIEGDTCEKSLENKVLYQKHNTMFTKDISASEAKEFQCSKSRKDCPFQKSVHHHTQSTLTQTSTQVKCDVCGLSLRHKIHLKHHKQRSHNCENKQRDKTTFKCEHCSKECASRKNLLYHIQSMHTTQTPSDCKVCGKTYRNPQLCREHMRTVHQVRAVSTKMQEILLLCTFCSHTFCPGSHQQIINHLQECHEQDIASALTCGICGTKFKRKFTLNYHMRNTHSVGVSDNETRLKLQTDKMHPCHKCGKTLSKNSMRRHMLMFHSKHIPVNCKICDKKLKSALHLERHMRCHRTLPSRVCHICGANLKTDQGLKSHLAAHKGIKSHVCDICGAGFVRRTSWQRHIRQHAETTFQCEVCIKSFTTDYALHSHLLSTHQRGAYFNNRLRTLEELGYVVDKEAVTRHLSHLCVVCGEKLIDGKCPIHPTDYMLMFQCSKCEMSAKHIEFFCHHLKRHNNPVKAGSSSSSSAKSYTMTSSTSNRGEATVAYTCKLCNKSFQRREYMSHHMKQHKEKAFSCPVCNMKFTYKCNMKNHLLTHSQDKPFTCEVCHKGFKRQDLLRCHARVHDPSGSPFKCHLCGKGLTRKQYLQQHYKLVHPEVKTVPAL